MRGRSRRPASSSPDSAACSSAGRAGDRGAVAGRRRTGGAARRARRAAPAPRSSRAPGDQRRPRGAGGVTCRDRRGLPRARADVRGPGRGAPRARSRSARSRCRWPPASGCSGRATTGDALYVVRAGRMHVLEDATGAVIRELGRGDALGELALLTGAPRSASVRAARASDLLAVDRDDFERTARSGSRRSPSPSPASLAEQLRAMPRTRAVGAPASRRPSPSWPLDRRRAVRRRRLRPRRRALAPPDDRACSAPRHAPAAANGSEPAGLYGPLLDRAEAAARPRGARRRRRTG